jgi:hypothetical protein
MFFYLIVVLSILFSSSCGLSPCDKECSQNEEFSINASQCQQTCWRRRAPLSQNCKTFPGCVCKRGFIRHPDTFECIPLDSCPPIMNHAQCPRNEIYMICSEQLRVCEKSCDDNRDENTKYCVCRNGCTCKKGFSRSSLTLLCVASCEGKHFLCLNKFRCLFSRMKNYNFSCIKNIISKYAQLVLKVTLTIKPSKDVLLTAIIMYVLRMKLTWIAVRVVGKQNVLMMVNQQNSAPKSANRDAIVTTREDTEGI